MDEPTQRQTSGLGRNASATAQANVVHFLITGTSFLRSMCRSYCSRSLTIFHRVTGGNSQGAITAAGLPLHFSSRSWRKWRQFLPTLPSRPQLRMCVTPQFNSRQVFHNLCRKHWWRSSAGEVARSARCDEFLNASVYEFSSPVVKPGHGFIIRASRWRV